MTDFYAQVHGEYGTSLPWSFGLHITSTQSESALLATWANAWANAWTNGTYGLETLYPTTTSVVGYSVATLNAVMKQVTKSTQTVSAPGTATGDTLPYLNAVVVSLRSSSIQRHARGRFFLPALEETNANIDVIIPAAVTRIKSAVTSVQSAIVADGSTVFVTNMHPLKDTTPAFQKTVITQFLVSNKPARQSRRTRKILPVYT